MPVRARGVPPPPASPWTAGYHRDARHGQTETTEHADTDEDMSREPAASPDAEPRRHPVPLVVYGPASERYDFGPGHPLTPRRVAPGIDLLCSVGAQRVQEPVVATDDALVRVHDLAYVLLVRQASATGAAQPLVGIVPWGDTPPFLGMHDAAAHVAGGSLMAMDRILAGSVTRAFHPGGGLHHAMRGRASGFCVYNDAALAVAKARDAGHRVLYVDLDVHHGDGVQAAFWDDPAVMTVSFHETGATLFPGTGGVAEVGGPAAPGATVNVPFEPGTSDASWLAALRMVVPPLADAFRPDILVSQHGSDTHVFDPLAHLRLTTNAMWEAARLLDRVADEHCGGRWLATGGGGYDAYRVVARAWALVWLAQAQRPGVPPIDPAWRERWGGEAERHRQAPLPAGLLDSPDVAAPEPPAIAARNARTAEQALRTSLSLLHRG